MLARMSPRLGPIASLVVLVVAVSSCGGRARVAEPAPAPSSGGVVIVEGSSSAYVEGSATVVIDPAPASGGTCSASLRVYDVRVRSGCVIDERVTASPGTLVYPCGGGAATVSFGASTFTGMVSPNGDVNLEIRTGFPFSDGCHWETKQFITGNLASSALAYEYREEPDPGQRGCAAACLGTASVTVSR
jgi:hypothetical protein